MAWKDNAQGLLGGLQRFSSGVNGLLFPGFSGAGVDPEVVRRAQAQAMMQTGFGLLGGQDIGRAYGMGQQAGWEPIEQGRREAVMRAAAADRQAMADERERRRKQEEAALAEKAALRARIEPLAAAGNWEEVTKILASVGEFADAKAAKDLGGKPGVNIETRPGPFGGQIMVGSDGRWQYADPPKGPTVRIDAGGGGGVARPPKPLPTSALRIVDEANQAISAAEQSKALVDKAITTLQTGGVQLGAVRNFESRARNFAGASDDNSRAYADIQQTLEKLRNNYLLLAKGVQTEGDAQRAWNSEIGENVQNDNALALQQLQKAQGMIDMALQAQNARVETVYSNFGGETPSRGAQSGQALDEKPPASQHKGRVIEDDQGNRFRSDGMTWKPL